MKNEEVIINELRKNDDSRIYLTQGIYITRLCETLE